MFSWRERGRGRWKRSRGERGVGKEGFSLGGYAGGALVQPWRRDEVAIGIVSRT